MYIGYNQLLEQELEVQIVKLNIYANKNSELNINDTLENIYSLLVILLEKGNVNLSCLDDLFDIIEEYNIQSYYIQKIIDMFM